MSYVFLCNGTWLTVAPVQLKCSGDANGCERCLAKKLDCHYPTPVRSNNEKKVATPPETPRETTQETRPPSIATVESSTEHDLLIESNQGSTHGSILQDLSPHFDVADLYTTAENTPVLLPDNDCSDPRQPEFYNFADITSDTPWSGSYEPEITAFCFDNESWPTVPPSTAGESKCHCIAQTVVTYEAIEVAAWGRRKLLNDFDVLQSQKMALAECEKLVECQNCNVQPAYIMLLLSMFRKILRTLEDICTSKGPKISQTTTNVDHEPHSGKRSRLSDECGDEGRASRQGYPGSTDNLKLDDEDKHLVLQSLLSARVGKSHHLLSMIDKVVSRHTWPAHEDLVRELRNRLTGGPLIIHRKQFIPSN